MRFEESQLSVWVGSPQLAHFSSLNYRHEAQLDGGIQLFPLFELDFRDLVFEAGASTSAGAGRSASAGA